METTVENRVNVQSRIPKFDSLEEEAAFWDTHDTTEFEDEFEPVELEVAEPLLHSISLRFEGESFQQMVNASKRLGVGPATLAERWVLEALRRLEPSSVEHEDSGE